MKDQFSSEIKTTARLTLETTQIAKLLVQPFPKQNHAHIFGKASSDRSEVKNS